MTSRSPSLSRRQFFKVAGVGTSALVAAACGGSEELRVVSANATGSSGCQETPSQAPGPFAADIDFDEVDITGGQPGSLLELNFTILDSDGCLPIEGANFRIWHANAEGLYSGIADQRVDTTGETFLRGTQVSDGNGSIRFTTIYPGWHTGRTAHLNIEVTAPGAEVFTSQLYFPDNVTNRIHTTHEAYADRGMKDTTNDTDGAGADLARLRMDVIEANTGHFASHTIGLSL